MPIENPSTSDSLQNKNNPKQILAALAELDEALCHLNNRYAQCVMVTPRNEQKALQKHLLERSDEYLRILFNDIFKRLYCIHAPPGVWHNVVKICREMEEKLGQWYDKYHSCMSSERYDDDLGIQARKVVLELQAKLEWVLRNPKESTDDHPPQTR